MGAAAAAAVGRSKAFQRIQDKKRPKKSCLNCMCVCDKSVTEEATTALKWRKIVDTENEMEIYTIRPNVWCQRKPFK